MRALPTLTRFAKLSAPNLDRATEMLLEHGHSQLLLPWLALSPLHLEPLLERLFTSLPPHALAKLATWAFECHGPEPAIIDALVRTRAKGVSAMSSLKGLATDLLSRGGGAENRAQEQVLLRAGYLAEAMAQSLEGDHQVARQLFIAAARVDRGRCAEPWLLAARSAFSAGLLDTATQDLANLRAQAPERIHYIAHGLALEARIALRRGQPAQAKRLLRRATRILPWDKGLARRLSTLLPEGGTTSSPASPKPSPFVNPP